MVSVTSPEVLALWRRIRERHAARPQPYALHAACDYCDSEGCWLDDYAAKMLRHAPTAAELPDVPEGTVLHLRAGEWDSCDDLAGANVNVRAIRVHTDTADPADARVWVSAHRMECAYPTVDRHPPCLEMRVDVGAIVECNAGQR